MWLDSKGTVHTVALARPADFVSREFLESLSQLQASSSQELLEWLSSKQDSEVESVADLVAARSGAPVDARELDYEGVPLPVGILKDPFSSVGDLNGLIEQIDMRWRIDALMIVEDLLQ